MYSKLFHISKSGYLHRQKQNKNIIKVPKGTKKKNTLIKKLKLCHPSTLLLALLYLHFSFSPVNPINRFLLLCTLTLSSRSYEQSLCLAPLSTSTAFLTHTAGKIHQQLS